MPEPGYTPREPFRSGIRSFPDKPRELRGPAFTGLTQIGARAYDSALGRFISPDPVMDVTDHQQMHGYTYAYNNPVTFTDPDGLSPLCIDVCGPGGYTIIDRGGKSVGMYDHSRERSMTYSPTQGWSGWVSTPSWRTRISNGSAGSGGSGGSSARPGGSTYQRQQAEAYRQAQAEKAEAKQKLISAATGLAQLVADELGITAGLECFTSGDLGACGETALNVALMFVGGLPAKLAAKYGLRWGKAAELGRRISALCALESQGADLKGTEATTVKVNGGSQGYTYDQHGENYPKCPSCTSLFDYLDGGRR